MNDVRVPWTPAEHLGDYPAHRLGGGGQGIVYGVPDPHGKFPGQSLVYKEYLPDVPYDGDVLYDMVCFRQLLDPAGRAFLDDRLTWPMVLVYRDATPTDPRPSRNPRTALTGFLMRRVGPEHELHSPVLNGVKQQAMEFLLNDDSYSARIGLPVDDARRLELLLDLARTVERLHGHGVAVGDLSPKNVLFTLRGQARCLLIDCDSMRFRGKDVLAQVDTPEFEVPAAEKATATVATDSYKFGLLAARVFNRSQESKDLAPLRAVSTQLANLAARAQNQDPQRRPRLAEWIPVLELEHGRVRHATPPPVVTPDPNPSQSPTVTAPTPTAPTPVHIPSTRPRQPASTGSRWFGWLLAALLVGVVGGYAATHVDGSAGAAGSDGSSSSPLPGTPSESTLTDGGSDTGENSPDPTDGATPSGVAVASWATVDYSQVADEDGAEDVARMFARFFGAINEHRYDTALKYYDPDTGVVDLGSASSRSKWKEVMSTTKDTDFVLGGLSSDGRYTLATLGFTSHQDAGYGPAGSPDDTCDQWTITYQLTDSDGYRIYKAPRDGVSYTSC
ncbi:lipopolysaccharide kinase InaA family protein [Streptomyces sp. NPDC004542]|uniref:lipopolysaccharide kinase InaA family protein n=1 Tax=Streptomyces sp. NPDC004542 TaxID=3154281 RepID=UPI0033A0ED09